jgi:hypothetical protein
MMTMFHMRALGFAFLYLWMMAASAVVASSSSIVEAAAEQSDVIVASEQELEVIDLFPEKNHRNPQLRRGSKEQQQRELQYMAPNKFCNWCGGPPSVKLGVVILGLGATSCHGAYQAGLNSQLPGNYCQPTRAYLYKKCGCGKRATANQYGSNGMGNWSVRGGSRNRNLLLEDGQPPQDEQVADEQPQQP